MFNKIKYTFNICNINNKNIYPIQNLYFGKYNKTITTNNTTYTYEHQDCFLGDAPNLGCCTKLKRLTDNNSHNTFDIDPTKFAGYYIGYGYGRYTLIDQENNRIYKIEKNLCPQELLYVSAYKKISLNNIQKLIKKQNNLNVQKAIALTKKQENIDEIFSHK